MHHLSFLLFLALFAAPSPTQSAVPDFAAFDHWRAAVLSGDSVVLAALYSKSPEPALIGPDEKPISLQDELAFWARIKSNGLQDLSAELLKEDDPRPQLRVLTLRLTLTNKEGIEFFVNVVQGWSQQGDHWLLVFSQRIAPARLRQPITKKEIYNAATDATAEIAEAVHSASASRQRILLVFGGNWCYDCHVLDEAFHSPEIAPTLNKSFLVVHVDIGRMDKNLDIAKKYHIPLDRGVPAISVLDSDGTLLFSQKRGEFEAARSMAPEDIVAFLRTWQPHP